MAVGGQLHDQLLEQRHIAISPCEQRRACSLEQCCGGRGWRRSAQRTWLLIGRSSFVSVGS